MGSRTRVITPNVQIRDLLQQCGIIRPTSQTLALRAQQPPDLQESTPRLPQVGEVEEIEVSHQSSYLEVNPRATLEGFTGSNKYFEDNLFSSRLWLSPHLELTRTGQFDQLSVYSTEGSEEIQVTPPTGGQSPTSTVCLYTLERTTPVTSDFSFIEDVYSNSDLMTRLRNLRGSLTTEPGPVPAPRSRMATRTTTVRAPPAVDHDGERTLEEQISYNLGDDRAAEDTFLSWPMVVPGEPIYSQAEMRNRHTGTIPWTTSMQVRLDEVNIPLPPPMVSV